MDYRENAKEPKPNIKLRFDIWRAPKNFFFSSMDLAREIDRSEITYQEWLFSTASF